MIFKSDIEVQLIDSMGGDERVVCAARVSTQGTSSVDQKESSGLINYLIKHKHGTPFEHSSITFFVNAPIFVWREWHRHRIGFSYNEESARYKQLDPVFWIPNNERPLIPIDGFKSARPKFGPATVEQFNWFVEDLKAGYTDAYNRYQERINRGYAKEAARAGLPVGIYSSCWVTCNPRSLMHFLSLRIHDETAKFVSYPQYEIEVAAHACEDIFAKIWPITYKAYIDNGRISP
jgi:thymidylate synthase (FAD)